MGRKEKEAYQEKAGAQLREWQAWIEQYKADPLAHRSTKAAGLQSIPAHREMTGRLEDCHRVAQASLEALRTTREERWELAKQAVERALIDLKQALDESGASNSNRPVQLQTNRSHVYEPFQRRG